MKPLTPTQKKIAMGSALVVLAIAGFALYRHFGPNDALPEGLIQANGRLEGDRMSLASKVPGRIAQILEEDR